MEDEKEEEENGNDEGEGDKRDKTGKFLPFSVSISILCPPYTDKKEKGIFLKYKEMQMGSVAKSYMRKGFLIFEEIRKY